MRRWIVVLTLAFALLAPAAARAQSLPPDPNATNDVLHPLQPFATAQCQDSWFSYSQTYPPTCAGHGGVMLWVARPGTLDGLINMRNMENAGRLGFGPIPEPGRPSPPSGCVSYTGGACATLCTDGTWSSNTDAEACVNHGGEVL